MSRDKNLSNNMDKNLSCDGFSYIHFFNLL